MRYTPLFTMFEAYRAWRWGSRGCPDADKGDPQFVSGAYHGANGGQQGLQESQKGIQWSQHGGKMSLQRCTACWRWWRLKRKASSSTAEWGCLAFGSGIVMVMCARGGARKGGGSQQRLQRSHPPPHSEAGILGQLA